MWRSRPAALFLSGLLPLACCSLVSLAALRARVCQVAMAAASFLRHRAQQRVWLRQEHSFLQPRGHAQEGPTSLVHKQRTQRGISIFAVGGRGEGGRGWLRSWQFRNKFIIW